MNGQEVEVKFFVQDLQRIETRLREWKARLIQERAHEVNLRFDLPNGELSAEGKVLRLRQDAESRLTFKGPSLTNEGVMSRREIEFTVSSFDSAREFLEALGYHKIALYEKYRTTYELPETKIMLDETPLGDFVEIEGTGLQSIRETANQLDLKWEAAVPASYLSLFARVRKNLNLEFSELSFDNFKAVKVTSRELEVEPADRLGV